MTTPLIRTPWLSVLGTALFGSAVSLAAPPSAPENSAHSRTNATITVRVVGIKWKKDGTLRDGTLREGNRGGRISIGLYSDAASYAEGRRIRGTVVAATSREVVAVFDDVPQGDYAIKLYHDRNADGRMNANLFGLPSEPYAFSNNAKAVFGPASWEKARFELGEDGVIQVISLE